MKVACLAILVLAAFLAPIAGADETGSYVLLNPWSASAPDCAVAPAGLSLGFGGACFDVAGDVDEFRVTIQDDVLGPGFGALNLCADDGPIRVCQAFPICSGEAEGTVPAGTTSASVVVFDPVGAETFCGLEGLAWLPAHGTITLTLTTSGS